MLTIIIRALNLSQRNELSAKVCGQPPYPDLSTCVFYLWEYLKGKVYESNPHTLDELGKNMQRALLGLSK